MTMRKPKIYVETTLFNFYFDKDRDAHADTVRLFKEIAAGKYEAFTSDAVLRELEKAPAEKQAAMLSLVDEYRISALYVDQEAEILADTYVAEGIVPRKYRADGIHIAVATVNDLDYIISMNFRHLVKVRTEQMVHAVNVLNGYRPIKIISPMEVVEDEDA